MIPGFFQLLNTVLHLHLLFDTDVREEVFFDHSIVLIHVFSSGVLEIHLELKVLSDFLSGVFDEVFASFIVLFDHVVCVFFGLFDVGSKLLF